MRPEEALTAALQSEADVRVAWLFGSRARGSHHEASDWDLLVLLAEGAPARRRVELITTLSITTGLDVDVVDLRRAPIELAGPAIAESRVLFSRSEDERVDWEARTLALYFDAQPWLRHHREAVTRGGRHERAIERHRAAYGAPRPLHRET